MGMFEKNKMDTKFRETLLRTVLVYQDLAKTMKSDPLALRNMSPLGIPMTGKELGKILGKKAKEIDVGKRQKADNDSVFWVVIDPRTGKPVPGGQGPLGYVKITQDIGDWLKKLNKQLDAWGQDSEIKALRKKRWITAGIVAAVVVTAVVITVVTLGTGTAAAGAAAASTGGTAAGGTAAGGAAAAGTTAATAAGTTAAAGGATAAAGGAAAATSAASGAATILDQVKKGVKGTQEVLGAYNQIKQGLQNNATLDETANLAYQQLSPTQQTSIQQTSLTTQDTNNQDTTSSDSPKWLLPAVGVGLGTLAVIGVVLALRK
jgi:hypothetical protein